MGKMAKIKEDFQTDYTVNRLKGFARDAPPKLPRQAGYYLIDKVPIVQWLPHYMPKWLVTDFIAGLTIGVMLIPQGLAYAKIATIPIEHGLYSSWIPAALAVIMGTSKDLSTGPTSILGLLTAEIIVDLKEEGYDIAEIASAVALMVGVYSLILGMFGLGFLLDYVSLPVLTGFISAAALIIGTKQLDNLVGLDDVPDGVFNIIFNMIPRIPEFDGPTSAVGFGSIAVMYALQIVGKKWGKKHFVIKFLSSSRAVIVLVIFTIVGFLVNKDLEEPLFAITKVETNGIIAPKMHKSDLVAKVATRAVAPLVAATLEHLAVGKGFGVKNGYSIDENQELTYLGTTNIVNSFFGAMSVSAAMSRTAVNSECGVKSPLNGAFTAGFILLTLYVLSPALYWIPKATLSAIIIMAVIHLFGPMSVFYKYWRISFADFAACMLSFWITIFVSTEVGIASAVGWSIAYTMLRSAFSKPTIASSTDNNTYVLPQPSNVVEGRRPGGGGQDDVQSFSQQQPSQQQPGGGGMELFIPSNVLIVNFNDAIFFPNALRAKNTSLQAVQVLFPAMKEQAAAQGKEVERMWSVAAEKKLERIRRDTGVAPTTVPLAVVVWDFSRVPFIDVAGITALKELKAETRKHAGKDVQIRIYGMCEKVRNRFWRADWKMVTSEEYRDEGVEVLYDSLERAVWDREEAVYMEKMRDAIEIEKTGRV